MLNMQLWNSRGIRKEKQELKRKAVLGIMLTLLFIGIFSFAFDIQQLEAAGTITIKADGSIEGTTDIMTVDNVTYTFTDNINDSIVVERSNIIIDGKGYTVQGSGSGTGFHLSGINNVTIKNTNIKDFGCCIRLESSSNNSIAGNNITNNTEGVLLDWSSNYNSISGNNITNSYSGITLNHASSNNSISGNNIANNNYGIGLLTSSGNTICHNNFINNTNHVYNTMDSTWDDGYPSGGNYWSNYTGVDLNHDGIGDTSHVIDANNTDRYPLMGMFHSFNTSVGEYVNVVSNSTIESFQHFESNSTIIIHVSNMTASQTHGFCRVSIPYEVMSEPFSVTIDGANPTYWNYTLYDNGTNRGIYFEYEHTTREVVIIPEFPSFLILPLFMIATLLAVIAYRRKHTL
jgi:parallel beta-helix repeat protein